MIAGFVNHVWQSTLFALAVALVVRVLRDDSARIRYALWLAASVKFLVPFSLLAALGERLAPAAQGPMPVIFAWSASLERLAEPVAADTIQGPIPVALLVAWAGGAVLVAARSALRAGKLAALVNGATPTAARASVPGAPPTRYSSLPIRYSSTSIEPALVGIVRPVLLMPRDVEARLSPAQLDAVIAHELCHWRRRDNLTGALHMLVEALFWFHPLVWWIGSRLVDERERACDEAVVEAGHDRRTYAEAILNVAELRVASPVKCAAGVGGVDLKSRITAVMRRQAMRKLELRKKLLLSFGAICAIAVPVASGWLTAPSSALAQREEYLPLVRVAPEYPAEAAAIGLEGYVIVEFTVNESGSVEDLYVVESSSPLFEQAALDAAAKFKYEPRIVDGKPVPWPGVRNVFRFVMQPEQDDFV